MSLKDSKQSTKNKRTLQTAMQPYYSIPNRLHSTLIAFWETADNNRQNTSENLSIPHPPIK